MSGKRGMLHYTEEMKEQVREEYAKRTSIHELSRKYGVSRWSIHCWCGLSEKVNLKQAAPLRKGRPRKSLENPEQLIRRLQMENELLRNFLSVVGRR